MDSVVEWSTLRALTETRVSDVDPFEEEYASPSARLKAALFTAEIGEVFGVLHRSYSFMDYRRLCLKCIPPQ